MEKGRYSQSGQSNKGQGSGAGASKSNYAGASKSNHAGGSKSYHAGASKSNHAGASKPYHAGASKSNYSKSHGKNGGAGGNVSDSSDYDPYEHETGEQTLRRICWDMAQGAGSYPEKQFLANYLHDRFMDGGLG